MASKISVLNMVCNEFPKETKIDTSESISHSNNEAS